MTLLIGFFHNTRVANVVTLKLRSAVEMEDNVDHMARQWKKPSTSLPASEEMNQSGNNRTFNNKTLALLHPPGLFGGYRNQAMRFFSLVHHAIRHEYTQLLLPTITWSTRYISHNNSRVRDLFWPVPMEALFDIDHWNKYHRNNNNNDDDDDDDNDDDTQKLSLPILVDSIYDTDCWNDTVLTAADHYRWQQQILAHAAQTSSRNGGGGGADFFRPPDLALATAPNLLRLSPLTWPILQYLSGHTPKFRQIPRLYQKVAHCQHPAIYGGGTGVGTLWEDYEKYIAGRRRQQQPHLPSTTQRFLATVHQALRPAAQWRSLAERCLQHHLPPPPPPAQQQQQQQQQQPKEAHSSSSLGGYAVLHARVESDMAAHKCGRYMEKNLTKIFHSMDGFLKEYNAANKASSSITFANNNTFSSFSNSAAAVVDVVIRGTMVALSRGLMQPHNNNNNNNHNNQQAIENWHVLNARSISHAAAPTNDDPKRRLTGSVDDHGSKSKSDNNDDNDVVVFECGEGWLQTAFYHNHHHHHPSSSSHNDNHHHHPSSSSHDNHHTDQNYYYGDILPAILDFWLAVQSDVFVGVKGSSWSVDVWTARYFQGRGRQNYEYTVEHGIVPVPNHGRPRPHTRC
jgi:hypothetical protein